MKYELVKFTNGNLELEISVSPEEDTVWLTKDQIALLFDRDRTVVSRHINNIYKEGELDRSTSVHFLHISPDHINPEHRPPQYYNLDVVISVGYRVKSQQGILFRRWATNVLKEYLLKGYIINGNRTLVTDENYINLINKVEKIDNRLTNLENESLFFPKTIVIYENEMFDSVVIISDIISRAKNNIVLIDPYVDIKTLNALKNKNDSVSISVFTSNNTKLSQMDIDLFNGKYGGLSVAINNKYHDRYLIVDDLIFYHLGSSINYLGNKFAQIDKIEDEDLKELLRKRINEQE